MISRIQIRIIALAFLFIIKGCISSYEFTPEKTENFLVISGRITQNEGPNDVMIFFTPEYGSARLTPVNGAEVNIYDDLGNVEALSPMGDGRYRHYGIIVRGSPGTSYYIEVTLPLGKTYRSALEKMPEVVRPVNLYAIPAIVQRLSDNDVPVSKKMVQLFIDTPVKDQNNPVWLRWSTETVFSFTESSCSILSYPKTCYISNVHNPGDINIYSSESISGNSLENHLVTSKEFSYEFDQRHFFNVAQLSLTRSAYEYWGDVRTISNPTGTIFEVPPAPVRGNIYNIDNDKELVLGYFEAVSVDTIRTFTTPDDLPWFSRNSFCGYYYNSDKCCDCLLFENSTDNPPNYWFE